jgi:hypothetical protein
MELLIVDIIKPFDFPGFFGNLKAEAGAVTVWLSTAIRSRLWTDPRRLPPKEAETRHLHLSHQQAIVTPSILFYHHLFLSNLSNHLPDSGSVS